MSSHGGSTPFLFSMNWNDLPYPRRMSSSCIHFHRIVVDLDAARIDATLFDADAPVVRWAIKTAKAIQGCRGL